MNNIIDLPSDLLRIIGDFNMVSEDEVKDNMKNVIDELKFYFFLQQELKLDKSVIRNRLELLSYMKIFFNDYLIFIV